MTRLAFLLTVFSLYLLGCLGGKSEKPAAPPVSAEPAPIATLALSVAKSVYAADEPVPLEATLQNGKFDLFVPYGTIEGKGAFIKLTVSDAAGNVVRPRYPITFANQTKTLVHKGREVRCIQGLNLTAGVARTATLEDLQSHYRLPPGDYALQLSIHLKVHRESLMDQSPQILELEHEIARIQANRKLPADAKQEATERLREEVEFIRHSSSFKSDAIFLPLNSLRGSAELQSNVVALKIQ